MENGVFGLVLANQGIIGPQGANGLPIDNSWTGTWTGFKTFTYNSNGNQNPLYVRSTGAFFPNTNSSSGGIDFQVNPTSGGISICPTVPAQLNGVLVRHQIAQNLLQFPVLVDESKVMARKYLFNSLRDSIGLMSADSILQSWYAFSANTNLEKDEDVNEMLEVGAFTTSSLINNLANPFFQIEVNSQTLNRIYADWMIEGGAVPTSQQISELQTIALQCPFEGGYAVYQARTLLCLAEICPDYPVDCGQPNQKSGEITNDAKEELGGDPQVFLVPNPATRFCQIFSLDLPDRTNIILMNVWGQTMGEFSFENGIEIPTDALPQGLYFLQFNLDERTLATKWLMIQE